MNGINLLSHTLRFWNIYVTHFNADGVNNTLLHSYILVVVLPIVMTNFKSTCTQTITAQNQQTFILANNIIYYHNNVHFC